jgi:hypothetical protein
MFTYMAYMDPMGYGLCMMYLYVIVQTIGIIFGGFLKWGKYPIAGWFMMEIPFING